MATIGSLIVNILANTTGFGRGMANARKRLNYYQKSVLQAQKATARFNKVLGAVGVTLGTAKVLGEIRETAEAINDLAKTSAKLGIATDQLAGLRFAGEQTGVSIQTMDMALQRMTRRLSEAAKDTGEAKDAIKELGLSAKQLSRLSPDQQFRKIAAAMLQVRSQSDRVRLAFKLFDSEGVALVNTLALGERGLIDMQRQAEDLGIALSPEATKKVEEFSDAMNRLKQATEGFKQSIVVAIAPSSIKAMDSLTDAMKGARIEGTALNRFSRSIVGRNWMLGISPLKWGLDRFGYNESWVRSDIARGVATGSPHQVGGTPQEIYRHPQLRRITAQSLGLTANMLWPPPAQMVAVEEQRTFERASRAIMGYYRKQLENATKPVAAVFRKVTAAAGGVRAGFQALEKAAPATGWRWLWQDIQARTFPRTKEKEREFRGINEALLAGTVEGYQALHANMLDTPIVRQQFAESKRQTKLLQLISNKLHPVRLQLVSIPR